MQVLLAVVEDLYTFAVSMLFPSWASRRGGDVRLYLPASRVVSTGRERLDVDVYHEHEAESSLEREAVLTASRGESALSPKHAVMYCTRAQVPLRAMPDNATDTAIAMIAYGDMVMVLEADETWSYVAVGEKRGYVPTQMLVAEAAGVYPAFVIGAENNARDANTIRLRSVIRDEFSASLTQLPLQAHEYVYYKLLRRGTRIAWPDIRPRTSGSWAQILSHVEGVTIGERPTVGAVMEFSLPEGREKGKTEAKAHLAYVEKVMPDQTIRISEADWPASGIYNERVLVKDEWRTFNPSFIAIG